MDLSDFDMRAAAEAGADMTILTPDRSRVMTNEDGTPMTIRLAGFDSDRYQAAARLFQDRRNKDAITKKRVSTIAEVTADTIHVFAQATLGWDITLDGKKPPFSVEAAADLYDKFRFIYEQVDEFIAERSNFMKVSSKS